MKISKSEAKSWYTDNAPRETHAPGRAHDGDYTTFYTVKDGDAVGNYLKLYLSQKHVIGTVKITNRGDGCCKDRILGTTVMVYSTEGGKETKVADCGEEITGRFYHSPPHAVPKPYHTRH